MKLKSILFIFIFQTFKIIVSSDKVPCGKNGLVDTDFIVGSTNDPELNPVGHWPWMASIGHYDDNKNWNHECGATLITDRHFLTAAHCVTLEWKIRIGDDNHGSTADDTNAKDLNILASFIHPNYNRVAAYFDVAVLETEPLNFSRSISPVCLPSAPSADIHKYDNDFVELIGWGKKGTSGNVSKRLKRISVKIFPQKYCNTTHTQTTVSTEERIKQKLPQLFQNHILCAGTSIGNQGSCNGDSGGPLNFYDSETFSWTQIGIVQGGIRDCGDPDYPGLYIRLDDPEVLNFIFEKTGRETETQKDIFSLATDYFHLESDIRITTQFLAPAKIECQPGQALNSFKLEERNGNEFHYIYQCKQLKSPVTIRTLQHYWTPWGHESLPEGWSEGSINFLDQQNVNCKTNEYLTSFQLEVDAEQSTIRYVYNCGQPEVQGSCEDRETEEYAAPGYTILGLDGVNVGCEENEVLSAFQMKSPPPFKLKYSYTCCTVN